MMEDNHQPAPVCRDDICNIPEARETLEPEASRRSRYETATTSVAPSRNRMELGRISTS